MSKYCRLRRTRGDGNCFFRAFAFAYLETLLEDHSDLPRQEHRNSVFSRPPREYVCVINFCTGLALLKLDCC